MELSIAHYFARICLFIVFGVASATKLAAPREFAMAVKAIGVTSPPVRLLVVVVVPAVELLLCGMFLLGVHIVVAACTATAMLTVFTGVLTFRLLSGKGTLDCGCGFGRQPVTYNHIVRNWGLIACAMSLVITTSAIGLFAVGVTMQVGTMLRLRRPVLPQN